MWPTECEGDCGGFGGYEKKEPKELQRLVVRANTCFHHVGYLIIALGGLLLGIMFFARFSISVTMLSMVNRTHLHLVEHPNVTLEELETIIDRTEDGEFNWSNELQQTITGSYMITYTLPQILAGRLCVKYGFRWSAFLGSLLIGISCMLMPVLAYLDWKWAIALRMLNGLGASGTITYIIMAIEAWLPPDKAATGLTIMQITQTSIIFISPLITGLVSAQHWRWGFYVPGMSAILVGLLWFLVVSDDPKKSLLVSRVELDRLESGQEEARTKTMALDTKAAAQQLPWWFMFKIKSFYLLSFSWIIFCAGEAVVFVVPNYFRKAYQLNTKDNGLYNFFIQSGVLFSPVWPGPLISLLQNWLNLSLTTARQVVVFILCFICTLSSLYVGLCHNNQVLTLAIDRWSHRSGDLLFTATLMSQYGPHGLSGPTYSTANAIGILMQAFTCWAVGLVLDLTGESYSCWTWVFVAFALSNVLFFLIYQHLKSEPVRIRDLEPPAEESAEVACKVQQQKQR